MKITFILTGKRSLRGSASRFLLGLTILSSFLFAAAEFSSAQTIPAATAASSALLGNINGQAGKIAANSLGDVFYVSQTDNTAYWLRRGSTTPVALITGLSGGRNAYVDSGNNVYVASAYGGFIVEVPFVNGTYATNVSAGGTPACASFAPTAPCQQGSASPVLAYYYQPVDVSMDAAGNLYALDAYPNGDCKAGDCIVKFTRGTTTYNNPMVIASNITGVDYNAQFNVAPNGDIYFANGKLLYLIAAGTTNPVSVGSFTNPMGVTTDASGNVYVTNSNTPYGIFELPAVGGVAQVSKAFELVSTYSGNSVAFDGLGDMFYTGYVTGVNLNVAQLNAVNLGTSNVGTAAANTPASITFTFATATTVTSITSNGAAFTYTPGSCAAGGVYAAASSCTVNVAYTPTAVGLQRGAISLNGATGTALSIALLSGVGNGAAETNDPGTLTAIGNGFVSPQGIRVDGAGDVYVADAGQNTVLRYAAGANVATQLGTGLSKPSSVTLDGAGNVFIADAGNGRVVEVPNVNGVLTNSAQVVIATGLNSTLSVATDRYGSLYIAEGNKTTVTKLGSLGGVPSTAASSTIGSGFSLPSALALDSNANLFVADSSANTVTKINFVGRATSTVGAGLSKPTGLVTDASGSLYIADSGNFRLIRIPLENGNFNTNDQYLVGVNINVPYGVGIDGAGNLYVTDNSKATVTKINRVAGTLDLGRAQINTSTAASNATIGNAGNAALTFGTPAYVATSNMASYFSVTSPATGGCKSGASLASGFACILSASFTPATTGAFNDLLTFTSNAANGAPQTLNITGRGLNLSATTTTLAQTAPAGTAALGQPVTITATIGTTVAGTPSGTVSFAVDGKTVPNPPAISGNKASVVLNNLTGGQHVITASYSGDDNYSPSNGSLTITVSQAATTTSLTITGQTVTPLSSAPNVAVTLVAKVVPGASTAPTGGVNFSSGGVLLNATPVPLDGSYTATFMTSALPVGTDVVTATYVGDVNYSSSSAQGSIIISYQTFVLTPSTASLTVSSGQTGSVNFTATSLSNFGNGAYLGFSCSGLPANSVCSFSPNGFVFKQDTPQNVTLQILTGTTPAIPQPVTGAGLLLTHVSRLSLALILLALAPLTFMGGSRARGKLRAMRVAAFALLLSLGAQTLSGCGSSSGLFGVTPSGSYTVTVTATGNNSSTAATSGPYAPACTPATDVGPYSTNYTVTCLKTATVTLVVK